MIKIHNNGIDAAISHMNYKPDGRLKVTLPTVWGDDVHGDTPVVYRIIRKEDNLLLQGFRVNKTQSGTLVHPKADQLVNGAVWVGLSSLFWSDYAVDGDGAPRFVAIANRFRGQNYEQFYIDETNPVWVGVLNIEDDIVKSFPRW